MDLGLQGSVALVTGGGAGIGAAIAATLADEGCELVIVDRRSRNEAEPAVRAVEKAGRRALYIQADVSSHHQAAAAVERTVRDLGRLDILVSNAGINRDGVIWKMSEEQWDAVLDVNLKGCFNYNKAAALVMKEARRGKIVNVSSINGLRGKFAQANYAASKGGEIALTKALARELGKFNVNVNAVAPGMVRTEMAAKLPPEVVEKSIDETVLGRIALPREIADVVAFLCSERARHITGEVIRIDGGQYI